MTRLLHSSKFWTMILDVIVSFSTYFLTKYAAPEMAQDVLFIIGGLQPVWLMVIGSIAYEDGKQSEANQTYTDIRVSKPAAEYSGINGGKAAAAPLPHPVTDAG
jgi:hypothetical protein